LAGLPAAAVDLAMVTGDVRYASKIGAKADIAGLRRWADFVEEVR
jgi:hypothetical protein